jgi:hypothetical protein
MLIKYKSTDKVMEVIVKKHGWPSQQYPLDKRYSGSLLVYAEKLQQLPAVNRPINENLRADSEDNKALDPEELD